MEKRIKGILFDKDGTLFNYGEVWGSIIDSLLRANIPMSHLKDERKEKCLHEFEKVIGIDMDGLSYPDGILFRHNNVPLAAVRILRLCIRYTLSIHKVAKAILSLLKRSSYGLEEKLRKMDFPDVRTVFREAEDRGLYIGIVTNDVRKSADMFLERMGVSGMVSFIRCGDSECRKKPNPEALFQFCSESGIKPEQVAVVGDTVIDMAFAKKGKAGYRAAVLTGSGDLKALQRLSDAVYPSLIDILSDPVIFPPRNRK